MAKKALRVLGSTYRDLDGASADRLTAENVERDLVFVAYFVTETDLAELVAQKTL